MIRLGFELWEELVRVPLLGCVPGGAGRRILAPRSLIDLAPTVLELLDVPVDAGALRGVSLLSDVTAVAPPQRPVLVDMARGPNNQERRAFLSGTHKLITSAGRVIGLYDLAADPGEKNDLSTQSPLVERLQTEMRAYLSTLRARAPGLSPREPRRSLLAEVRTQIDGSVRPVSARSVDSERHRSVQGAPHLGGRKSGRAASDLGLVRALARVLSQSHSPLALAADRRAARDFDASLLLWRPRAGERACRSAGR